MISALRWTPVAAAIVALVCVTGAPTPVLAQSYEQQCQYYAHDVASRRTAGQFIGRTAIGTIFGGAIGALAGDVGTGLAIGSGAGAITGLAGKNRRYQRVWWDAYNWCMSRY